MNPFQERVVIEKNELTEKLEKLVAFKGGQIWNTLQKEERRRLSNQILVMDLYVSILEERIQNFQ